jgi:hypothetical protein
MQHIRSFLNYFLSTEHTFECVGKLFSFPDMVFSANFLALLRIININFINRGLSLYLKM